MTKLIKTPFADSGDKAVIPDTDAAGNVNWTQGFPADYSKNPDTDPSAKRIERDDFNGLLNFITSAVREIQVNGVAPFITAADNGGSAFTYGKGALVIYNNAVYQSLKDTNNSLPTVQSDWALLINSVDNVGRLIGYKTFTANGPYTPTPGTTKLIVEVQGAGGGGGYARATSMGNCAVGTGGGAGGYAKALISPPPASETVVVGSGGDQGQPGGESRFGNIVGSGGGGGANAETQFPDNTIRQFVGGVGGNGSGPGLNFRGGNGGSAMVTTSGNLIGGAGGQSHFSGATIPPSGNAAIGGAGSMGAGGTGAISSSSPSSPFAGGRGGNGLVIVWEYS